MALPELVAATMPVGNWQARLTVQPGGRVSLAWRDPAGHERARLPRAVALAQAAAVCAVKTRVADIERALGEARRRLEGSLRDGRDWAAADWAVRYARHPLTRTLAARLIWRMTPAHGTPFDQLGGDPVPAGGRVRLWRPLDALPAQRAAWRERLLVEGVRQPFFQAWRPVYELTAPELATATYSNRFAGLVLDQPVFVRVLRGRGWRVGSRMLDCVPKDFAPARLPLPAWGLCAEWWGTGEGEVVARGDYDAPNFPLFATSQLRFYATGTLDAPDRRALPLTQVPPAAFAEALFDCDLVSGIAAVGWAPGHVDPGRDAAPPPPERRVSRFRFDSDAGSARCDALGEARREQLAWLLPRLARGDRLRLDDHWLHVRGDWNAYAVHLGNAAVRIAATNRHVCIVPAKGSTPPAQALATLAGMGDDVLSLILSKALMLTDESTIRDHDIACQLR